MKKLISIIFTLVFCITSIAAQTKDYQKQMEDARKQMEKMKADPALRKKMEEAQQQLDRIKADPETQKQMAQAASALDTMKKLHPESAQVKMPDLGAAQIPNIDSLTKNIDADLSKMSQFSKGYFDALDKTMPKQNMLHHAEKLPLLTNAALVIMAREVLKNIKPSLNTIEVTNLDKIAGDTNTNAAGTGAVYLSTGASKNAAAYLICKGILKNPKDAWAINAFGVYFRDEMLYEKSLQCYFYANDLDAGKSPEINTNIGWVAAYYGDFDAAQKYFEKALSIQKDYNSALEGEALLAYRKGDLPALFKCLAKQIKTFGGSAGHSGGPSEAFTSLCGGISNENNNINLDTQPDPTTDHTYDNPAADEDGVLDPPPGADVEDINYPSYRPIFVKDAKEIFMAAPLAVGFFKQSFEKRKRYLQEASQKLKSLKPLGQAPYIDDEGFFVFEHSFKKFVDLFEPATTLFERRIVWYKQKYEKKIHPLLLSIGLSDVDLCKRYYAALAACSGNAACFQRVNCEWLPRLHGSKNADLEAITKIWSDYSDNIRRVIQWYADATAPYISRVHDPGWNEYLNMKREFAVRGAILESYDEWGTALMMINTGVCTIIQQPMPACQTELKMLDGGPDPFAKKPKHLKTFAGPCYTEPVSRDIGFAFYENNCQHTIYGIGTPAFRAFHEDIYNKKFKEDNKTRSGFIIGTSKSFGIDEKIGDNITGQATAKADLELEAQAKFYHEFNSEGVMTETGTEINVSAKGTLEVGVNAGPVSAKASQSLGIEAGMNVKVVDGQAQIAGVTGQITH